QNTVIYLNVQSSLVGRLMKVLLLALLLFTTGAFAESQEKVASNDASAGKSLILTITVPASRTEARKAFATSEGLSTWLTPNAVVDLRAGGEWTAHYPGRKTGGRTTVRSVPEQQFVIPARA